MMDSLAIGYDDELLRPKAEALSQRLGLPINQLAGNRLLFTLDKLVLTIPPFLPLHADFNRSTWKKRHDAGKKQGLVRACKPALGLTILDATAGWGRDAAVLASFGATVIMLERNPVMAALLDDALHQREDLDLNLSLIHTNAMDYLRDLSSDNYPDIIYIDPMHPERQKAALVKKDLQILQQLIGPDDDALALIHMACTKALKKVVVKWPQQLASLQKPDACISGKTVRFDIYHPLD